MAKPKIKLNAMDSVFMARKKKNLKINFKETKNRQLAYSKVAKEIVHNTPELIKSFLLFSKSEKTKYIDPKKRYYFLKTSKTKGGNSDRVYKFVIRTKQGLKKYFIKEMRPWAKPNLEMLDRGSNSFHELKAIEKLRKLNISVIDAHFAYVDKNRSFIVYDYVENMPVLWDAQDKGLISKEKYNELDKKLLELRKETKEKYLISDINSMNAFIELKTERLYLFDPLLKSRIVSKY